MENGRRLYPNYPKNRNSDLRIVVIVQARMASTRLRGKVLKEVLEKPLLSFLLERLKHVKGIDQIVIATTTNPEDQEIVEFCHLEQAPFYRGSSEDVLDRFYRAAKPFAPDIVIRVTSDCPLIDPKRVEEVLHFFVQHFPNYDYVSNSHIRSFPVGMDTEVFSFKALEEAALEATLPEEREHVTPFIYRRPKRYKLGLIKHDPSFAHYRLTVDTAEDFELISRLIQTLYPSNPCFSMEDIIEVLNKHPDWMSINAAVKHKEIR